MNHYQDAPRIPDKCGVLFAFLDKGVDSIIPKSSPVTKTVLKPHVTKTVFKVFSFCSNIGVCFFALVLLCMALICFVS